MTHRSMEIVLTKTRTARITRFLEKPKGQAIFSKSGQHRLLCLRAGDLQPDSRERVYLFGKQLYPQLLEFGRPTSGHLTTSYWRDVGNLAIYRKPIATRSLLVNITFPVERRGNRVWIGENVEVDPTAEIGYPVVIGAGCRSKRALRSWRTRFWATIVQSNAVRSSRNPLYWDGAVAMRDTWLERSSSATTAT